MRLIDADALKNEFPKDSDWNCPVHTNSNVCELIDAMPTIEPERKKGEWIPCSERLPEDGQIVLISQTYGWTEFEEGTEVTVAQFKRGYFTWYRYQADWDKHTSQMHHGDICPGIEYVDAWMPMPEPYKEDES